MTEWTPTVGALKVVDDASVIARPARTLRRSALRAAPSRRDLYADAGAQARLVRGRDAFVWRGRVLPIGLPLAAAAGALIWRRRRSTRDGLAAFAGVGLVSYLEARAEWSLRRRAYRRRHRDD
jgi:hypothetical protein